MSRAVDDDCRSRCMRVRCGPTSSRASKCHYRGHRCLGFRKACRRTRMKSSVIRTRTPCGRAASVRALAAWPAEAPLRGPPPLAGPGSGASLRARGLGARACGACAESGRSGQPPCFLPTPGTNAPGRLRTGIMWSATHLPVLRQLPQAQPEPRELVPIGSWARQREAGALRDNVQAQPPESVTPGAPRRECEGIDMAGMLSRPVVRNDVNTDLGALHRTADHLAESLLV